MNDPCPQGSRSHEGKQHTHRNVNTKKTPRIGGVRGWEGSSHRVRALEDTSSTPLCSTQSSVIYPESSSVDVWMGTWVTSPKTPWPLRTLESHSVGAGEEGQSIQGVGRTSLCKGGAVDTGGLRVWGSESGQAGEASLKDSRRSSHDSAGLVMAKVKTLSAFWP